VRSDGNCCLWLQGTDLEKLFKGRGDLILPSVCLKNA
jgi:hypothetical protein